MDREMVDEETNPWLFTSHRVFVLPGTAVGGGLDVYADAVLEGSLGR
jgi:hypothetical protein